MRASNLRITPGELSFPFKLSKIVMSTLMLYNTSVTKIAYKVTTTNPNRYGVQPSSGFVDAGSATAILIAIQKHQAFSLDLAECKDKFLIQWVSVQPCAHKVTSTLFDPLYGDEIHALRLCVRFKVDPNSLATTAITKPSRWKLSSLRGLFKSSNHLAESTTLQQQSADLQEQKACLAGQAQNEVQQAQAYQNKHLQLMVRLCGLSKAIQMHVTAHHAGSLFIARYFVPEQVLDLL